MYTIPYNHCQQEISSVNHEDLLGEVATSVDICHPKARKERWQEKFDTRYLCGPDSLFPSMGKRHAKHFIVVAFYSKQRDWKMSQSTPGTKIFRYGLTDGEHYWSKATYKQIAKYLISDLNMSEKTMERAITELVEEGIIIKQEAPKGLQTVFYKKGRTIKDNTRMFRLNMDK